MCILSQFFFTSWKFYCRVFYEMSNTKQQKPVIVTVHIKEEKWDTVNMNGLSFWTLKIFTLIKGRTDLHERYLEVTFINNSTNLTKISFLFLPNKMSLTFIDATCHFYRYICISTEISSKRHYKVYSFLLICFNSIHVTFSWSIVTQGIFKWSSVLWAWRKCSHRGRKCIFMECYIRSEW